MRIVAISDLHGDLIPVADLPEGDTLVIAGDVLPEDFNPPRHGFGVGTTRIMRQGMWFDEVWVPYLAALGERFTHVLGFGYIVESGYTHACCERISVESTEAD